MMTQLDSRTEGRGAKVSRLRYEDATIARVAEAPAQRKVLTNDRAFFY